MNVPFYYKVDPHEERYLLFGCGTPGDVLSFNSTFLRVRGKTQRLEEILRKPGSLADAFLSTLTPTMDSIKTNTETVLKIEELLDLAFDKAGLTKTN